MMYNCIVFTLNIVKRIQYYNNMVDLIRATDTNIVQSYQTNRNEAEIISQLQKYNRAGVKSLCVRLEKLKKGGRG